MNLLSRAVFAGVSLVLSLAALILIGLGIREAATGILASGGETHADAVLDGLGYLIIAIAVFDVAKYLFDEEVRRDSDKRSAAEARRSLTKFLSTIVIALFLEALVVVFKVARGDLALLVYPSILVVSSVLVLVGLGAFQRFSAAVEEKVGEEDEVEARKDKARR